jgi:hypothetical protein
MSAKNNFPMNNNESTGVLETDVANDATGDDETTGALPTNTDNEATT